MLLKAYLVTNYTEDKHTINQSPKKLTIKILCTEILNILCCCLPSSSTTVSSVSMLCDFLPKPWFSNVSACNHSSILNSIFWACFPSYIPQQYGMQDGKQIKECSICMLSFSQCSEGRPTSTLIMSVNAYPNCGIWVTCY